MSDPDFIPGENYMSSLDMSEPAVFVLKISRLRKQPQIKEMEDKIKAALESFDPRHKLVTLLPGESLEPMGTPNFTMNYFPGIEKGPWDDEED